MLILSSAILLLYEHRYLSGNALFLSIGRLIGLAKRRSYDAGRQERAELIPSIAFFKIHDQEVARPAAEVAEYIIVVIMISR